MQEASRSIEGKKLSKSQRQKIEFQNFKLHAELSKANPLELKVSERAIDHMHRHYAGKPLNIRIDEASRNSAARRGREQFKQFSEDLARGASTLNKTPDCALPTNAGFKSVISNFRDALNSQNLIESALDRPEIKSYWDTQVHGDHLFVPTVSLGFAGQLSGNLRDMAGRMHGAFDERGEKSAQNVCHVAAEMALTMSSRINQARTLCMMLKDPEVLRHCSPAELGALQKLGSAFESFLKDALDPYGRYQQIMTFAASAAENPEAWLG